MKVKPGDQASYTDENGIEHRNVRSLEVHRSKVVGSKQLWLPSRGFSADAQTSNPR
jgi:hypothetical protein